ncbi:Gp49 family protein [Clostridium beijerinckii]|uniref:Uncharacterized protein n=1 Tax=Clostridium beijerinckii TaxID=1520 RepID=A0A1S8PGY5_CLOBE|nr:Gp49 family protein [Clostridium beijerinckii]MBA8935536.1 hypothetical protein [Clostridium beijerinckii]NRU39931.1 hypothetical protein [Clostridium beijerinckii]NSA96790.1 hypothetical protein [Clostridium beijerinckii]NSB15841.1 hypothetical protein [Clostridium beijerinckii]OOM27964.1 hypothetical protein CLOBE_28820 [Clostridium beijerinckii]
MNYYIGTTLVKAQPMTRGEYNQFKGWEAPKGEDQTIDGYLVEDETGYTSWRPGCQFDKYYLKVDDNPNLPSGVSVGPQMVNDFIVDYEVFTKKDKITIVIATLVNGFTIVESSACVDPVNYNEEIGAEICKERIKNQVWNQLGFLLQTAYKGIKNN